MRSPLRGAANRLRRLVGDGPASAGALSAAARARAVPGLHPGALRPPARSWLTARAVRRARGPTGATLRKGSLSQGRRRSEKAAESVARLPRKRRTARREAPRVPSRRARALPTTRHFGAPSPSSYVTGDLRKARGRAARENGGACPDATSGFPNRHSRDTLGGRLGIGQV